MTGNRELELVLTGKIRDLASCVLDLADAKGLRISCAESCTGGLLAAVLTGLPGKSHSFESGFIVYSDEAKVKLLDIPAKTIEVHGAVSKTIAISMAEQCLRHGSGDIALSITGFAGPAEDDEEEGLVHLAVARSGMDALHREVHFGAIGRDAVRRKALETGLEMLTQAMAA
ncbi:MAG: CinA family protein [Erythrobacter sp.]|nr:MAG: CinA family protein [Erythrobacter sp.]